MQDRIGSEPGEHQMARPTPTQDENDQAVLGVVPMDKQYDQSGIDWNAIPPETPPPELPELPEPPPGEPEPHAVKR
jgi:hypothetical protein